MVRTIDQRFCFSMSRFTIQIQKKNIKIKQSKLFLRMITHQTQTANNLNSDYSTLKSAVQIHLRFPRAAAEPPCANALRSLT